MKPHKHAEFIKAWADGAEIQFRYNANIPWNDVKGVCGWDVNCEFRIKPQPKPDVVEKFIVSLDGGFQAPLHWEKPNLKLVFDGETGALKSAEVL